MKIEVEVQGSELVTTNEQLNLEMATDIQTGEVTMIQYSENHINKVFKFIQKSRTEYNKFLNSRQMEDFIN